VGDVDIDTVARGRLPEDEMLNYLAVIIHPTDVHSGRDDGGLNSCGSSRVIKMGDEGINTVAHGV
jgi:hypothetical protein